MHWMIRYITWGVVNCFRIVLILKFFIIRSKGGGGGGGLDTTDPRPRIRHCLRPCKVVPLRVCKVVPLRPCKVVPLRVCKVVPLRVCKVVPYVCARWYARFEMQITYHMAFSLYAYGTVVQQNHCSRVIITTSTHVLGGSNLDGLTRFNKA